MLRSRRPDLTSLAIALSKNLSAKYQVFLCYYLIRDSIPKFLPNEEALLELSDSVLDFNLRKNGTK